MKFSQMNSCNDCCLYNKYCIGDVKQGANGTPIYPPCTEHPSRSDTSMLELIKKKEANAMKKEHEERLKALKQEERDAKNGYIDLMLREERQRMKAIRKEIKDLEAFKDGMESAVFAKGVADSIITGKSPNMDNVSKSVSARTSEMTGKIESLKYELSLISDRANRKRQQIKQSDEYRLIGLTRCPKGKLPKDFDEWKADLKDYASVDTLDLMSRCMRDLSKNGFPRSEYVLAFVRETGSTYRLYAFSKENGREDLGYVDTYYNTNPDEQVYVEFINSVKRDLGHGNYGNVEAIVMPSSSKYRFFLTYPACLGSASAFWGAVARRGFKAQAR